MSHLGQISDAPNKLDSTWKLVGCIKLVLNLVIKICFGVLFKTFCPVLTERREISQIIFFIEFCRTWGPKYQESNCQETRVENNIETSCYKKISVITWDYEVIDHQRFQKINFTFAVYLNGGK